MRANRANLVATLLRLSFAFCFLVVFSSAWKGRSWVGPASFVEGVIQKRSDHGFTAIGNIIYIFGGISDENIDRLLAFNPGTRTFAVVVSVSGSAPGGGSGARIAAEGAELFAFGGLIGDFNHGPFLGDLRKFNPATLEWNSISSAVSGIAPSRRAWHGFTSCRGMLYVHGGWGGDYFGYLDDLHQFDPAGRAWTDISSAVRGTSSSARYRHGFTCCAEMLYVHGGFDSTGALGDLHSFDLVGRTWTDLTYALSGTSPSARGSHGFTCCGGMLYVHGGSDSAGAVWSDLHKLNLVGRAWSNLNSVVSGTAPSMRFSHGFTCCEGMLYVHGGESYSGVFLSDMHKFDPVRRTWASPSLVSGTPPSARYYHGLTSFGGILYVHGGFDNTGLVGDLHKFDLAWTDLSSAVSGTAPSARYSHGFTSCEGMLYVHGGGSFSGVLGDLHRFDPARRAWTDLSTAVSGNPPSARFRHAFTSCEGMLYVHGGYIDPDALGDLHQFDPVGRVWTDLSYAVSGTPPLARWSHGFTCCGGMLYVHGGFGDSGFLSDMYMFDLVRWAWISLSSVSGTPPSARYFHGFTCCGEILYVHGGCFSGGALGDLRSFDPVGRVWTDLSSTVSGTPVSARFRHGFTCCAGLLFVHGGYDSVHGARRRPCHLLPITLRHRNLILALWSKQMRSMFLCALRLCVYLVTRHLAREFIHPLLCWTPKLGRSAPALDAHHAPGCSLADAHERLSGCTRAHHHASYFGHAELPQMEIGLPGPLTAFTNVFRR